MPTWNSEKHSPGAVRDAIIKSLKSAARGKSIEEIRNSVVADLGPTASSSIRSYLRLNTPGLFARLARGRYALEESLSIREDSQGELGFFSGKDGSRISSQEGRSFNYGSATIIAGDCLRWLDRRESHSVHAVVTDPPYGLVEYSDREQAKLQAGRGGVWRIPPSFDGHQRSPLPRFTVLTVAEINELERFFFHWACALFRVLVPGAHVIVASNPLLSYVVANAGVRAGLERRGEIIRLTMTMRGGDRPKAAHEEFAGVSVMPRSMWEPWLIFRKPLTGRVQDNLRQWKTGGFRRPSAEQPFGDVISSRPTRPSERKLAPHPSLKPQAFLRQIVRAVLPLGEGLVLDPFAGSGSTLAAAEALGYASIGVERNSRYFDMACVALPKLARLVI